MRVSQGLLTRLSLDGDVDATVALRTWKEHGQDPYMQCHYDGYMGSYLLRSVQRYRPRATIAGMPAVKR